MTEYRMRHQPDPLGPRMPEAGLAFPNIFEIPRVYMSGVSDMHTADSESMLAISRAKSNPDAMIRIYRAVPHGVTTINPGDWVTPSKSYATMHGMHPEDPALDLPVISSIVTAKELRTEGNSIHEWGWFPENTEPEYDTEAYGY